MTLYHQYQSPLGKLLLTAGGAGPLTGIFFEKHRHVDNSEVLRTGTEEASAFEQATSCLDYYFSHGFCPVEELPEMELKGTDFQLKIWKMLLEIKPGTTITYGELARQLNNPGAVRAVGGAVGRNPVSILIPCHRVVGSNKKITGYAGGIENKRWLLEHENSVLREAPLLKATVL